MDFNLKKGKKAAVTIFIIIGLLILIMSLLLFYMRTKVVGSNARNLYQMSAATSELRPVVILIEDCLVDIGKNGLRRLGVRGGYIYPERYGFRSHPIYSYQGNAVKRFPDSEIEVPYWYHLVGNDCPGGVCQFGLGIPLLYKGTGGPADSSIESQLDDYIEENMLQCIGGIHRFSEMGFHLTYVGDITANTIVTPDTVDFWIEWPLKFTFPGSENEHVISEFVVSVPLRLKELYTHAMTITGFHIEESPFERLTLTSLIGYTGLSDRQLPPFSRTDFSLRGSNIWIKYMIQQDIENILSSNIPLMQYYDARNYIERAFPNLVDNYIYNVSMYIPSATGAYRYDVNFDYNNDWGSYVNLNCEGQMCRGESLTLFSIIPTGMQRYKFYYNISYPVLITLFDEQGLDQEGYIFNFFLETNLRYNDPVNHDMELPATIEIDQTSSFLCEERFFNSGLINITAYDSIIGPYNKVKDVDISFSCGEESCYMGRTDDNGLLQGHFPPCFGGFVHAFKEGYVSEGVPLSTFIDSPDRANIMVNKLRKIGVRLLRYNMFIVDSDEFSVTWDITSFLPSFVHRDQFAIVRFEKITTSPFEEQYTAFGIINGSNPNPTEFEISPGNYTIYIDLFDTRPFRIPAQRRTFDGGWFNSDITIDIPEVYFDKILPVGMLRRDHYFQPWELDNNNLMTLKVVSPNFYSVAEHNRRIEMIEVMEEYESISDRFRGQLAPEFS